MGRWVKSVAKTVFAIRMPGTGPHRVLAYTYLGMRAAWYELERIVFFQPIFESLCASVGPGVRMEVCPDSKLPMISNVDLHLGRGVRFSARTSFSGARNANPRAEIRIGDHTYLGHRCVVRAGTKLTLGQHVLLASNVLLSGDPGHPLEAVARRNDPAPQGDLAEIVIEDDAWLAYNVTVLGNVRIGRGAVVAANAVVTRDVPPYALVAGNPARVIRSLAPQPVEVEPVSASAGAAAPPSRTGNEVVGSRGGEAKDDWLEAYRTRFYARYAELFLSESQRFDEPTEARLQALWNRVLSDLTGSEPRSEASSGAGETNVAVPPGRGDRKS